LIKRAQDKAIVLMEEDITEEDNIEKNNATNNYAYNDTRKVQG
jgi:hypothetical protein